MHAWPLTPKQGNRLFVACSMQVACLLFPAIAAAQDAPKPAPPAPFNSKELLTVPEEPKSVAKQWADWVDSGEIPPGEEPAFDNYVTYRVEELTRRQAVEKSMVDLMRDWRKDLAKAQAAATNSATPKAQVRDRLVATLTTELPKIIEDPAIHSSSRINCVILLCDLNSPGASLTAAPLPQVVTLLRKWVPDSKLDEAVRVPALDGLTNAVRGGAIADADFRSLVRDLIAIVQASPSDNSKRRDGQVWLRRRAIELLRMVAATRAEANTPEVADAMIAIMGSRDVDMPARSAAAGALGVLNASAISRDKFAAARQSMLTFLHAATSDQALISALAVPAPSVANPKGKATTSQQVKKTRTRELALASITYRLASGLQGLKGAQADRGLLVATDDAGKAELNPLVDQIEKLLAAVDERKAKPHELNVLIAELSTQLDGLVNPTAPAAPAAAAPENSN